MWDERLPQLAEPCGMGPASRPSPSSSPAWRPPATELGDSTCLPRLASGSSRFLSPLSRPLVPQLFALLTFYHSAFSALCGPVLTAPSKQRRNSPSSPPSVLYPLPCSGFLTVLS